jgi:lysophospholipase L1-like esterase
MSHLLASFLAVTAALHGSDPVTIVTLGDSITKGVRTGVKTEETFSYLLQEMLHKEGAPAKIINVGVGGERTDQALARLDKIVALKPHIVVVMYGTNDSWVDKGQSKSRLTLEEYRANLKKLVAELRKAKITPILMTEPRLGDKHGLNGAGEHPNKNLEQFVEVCRKVAADTETPLVDNFAHWDKQNAARTDVGAWTTDQCHPNLRGHQEIANTMLPIVKQIVQRKK